MIYALDIDTGEYVVGDIDEVVETVHTWFPYAEDGSDVRAMINAIPARYNSRSFMDKEATFLNIDLGVM